jgi:hypothetical protein
MALKSIVEEILRNKKRSLSWLSIEMDKSVDGLRLSLVRESIKYGDINRMAEILEVSPAAFFEKSAKPYREIGSVSKVSEPASQYSDLKYYKGMCAILKDQLNDKEKIITLLSNAK